MQLRAACQRSVRECAPRFAGKRTERDANHGEESVGAGQKEHKAPGRRQGAVLLKGVVELVQAVAVQRHILHTGRRQKRIRALLLLLLMMMMVWHGRPAVRLLKQAGVGPRPQGQGRGRWRFKQVGQRFCLAHEGGMVARRPQARVRRSAIMDQDDAGRRLARVERKGERLRLANGLALAQILLPRQRCAQGR